MSVESRLKGSRSLFDSYIHYGVSKEEYMPEWTAFKGYSKWDSACIGKPSGLWGSPSITDDWREWCLSNDFHIGRLDRYFKFSVKDFARILRIEKADDMMPYVIIEDGCYFLKHLNQKLIQRYFDGMEVVNVHKSDIFNSWDVDSICIWNSDVIEVL